MSLCVTDPRSVPSVGSVLFCLQGGPLPVNTVAFRAFTVNTAPRTAGPGWGATEALGPPHTARRLLLFLALMQKSSTSSIRKLSVIFVWCLLLPEASEDGEGSSTGFGTPVPPGSGRTPPELKLGHSRCRGLSGEKFTLEGKSSSLFSDARSSVPCSYKSSFYHQCLL